MAIQTGVNSTAPNTIKWATAGTDPFSRQDHVRGPVENFDLHDHSSGKCLPVARVAATSDIVGTMTSATAVTIGRQGATNPALQVDTSTALSTGGVAITANTAGNGVSIAAIGSTLNEPLVINAKGSGTITLGNTSTGNIQIGGAVNGNVIINSVPETRVFNSANESITSGVTTDLTFNSERFDTDTIHDTGVNTNRLTCKTAGKYLIMASVEFAANATGQRYASIKLNGTTYLAIDRRVPSGTNPTDIAMATVYALAVNDYVTCEVFQDSGGALNVVASANSSPEFGMVKIG